MEDQKSALLPSLGAGVILGIALVVFSLILYITEQNENIWLALLSYVILAGVLYFAIVNFRDKNQNGYLTYGKGVRVGFLTGLFASIILAIFLFVYVSYIDSDILNQAAINAEESILERSPNIGDAELEQALAIVGIFATPVMTAVMTIFWYSLVSLVFSLIISIFAKQEDANIIV